MSGASGGEWFVSSYGYTHENGTFKWWRVSYHGKFVGWIIAPSSMSSLDVLMLAPSAGGYNSVWEPKEIDDVRG